MSGPLKYHKVIHSGHLDSLIQAVGHHLHGHLVTKCESKPIGDGRFSVTLVFYPVMRELMPFRKDLWSSVTWRQRWDIYRFVMFGMPKYSQLRG